MFAINEDKSIYLTRGDVAFFALLVKTETGEMYKFQPGDVIRFKVYEKNACENVVLSKDFGIETETEEIEIYLEEKDTKIGGVISKPVDYWYEVELNPYTDPQTIIGYDDDGAKIFKLFPEGHEKEDEEPITPEDIPVVDEELSLTSTRPVQNQAVARAILKINADVDVAMANHTEEINKTVDDKLEALKVEDISDKFGLTVFGCTLQKEVYKQGNVISGNITIAEFTSQSRGFTLDDSVVPKHDVIAHGLGFDSEANVVGTSETIIFSSTSNLATLVNYSNPSEVITISFSYICK